MLQHILYTLLLLLVLGFPTSGWAAPPEEAYDSAISLIDRLYLHPDEVNERVLLQAAAYRASEQIHWLMVESSGDTVYLYHGSGAAIGSLTVGSMQTLPSALVDLEKLLLSSGYDLDGVPVRLTLLKGITDALDYYSRILADEAKARFDTRLKGTLVGAGLTLQWNERGLMVTDLVTGAPADLGGVRVGDRLLRIDGRSVASMPVSEASRRIRGEEGTQVVLVVQRDGEPRTLPLTRAEVIVPNVRYRVLEGQVGYISIGNVSQKTVHNLLVALDELRDLGALDQGLVLDLRGNTGGSMKEAARAADVFVQHGLLLRTVGRDGGRVQNLQERMVATPGGAAAEVPLVVVVNDRTASGSEILAGALVELQRAVLVGTRTYGKGSVQKLYPLDPNTDLKLTVAEYLLHADREIDALGLVPDVTVGSIEVTGEGVRYSDYDEGRQRTEWDQILPWVLSGESTLGQGIEDMPLEVARRAAATSTAPTREAGLEALQTVSDSLRVEEEGRLVSALERLGLDWSTGETEPEELFQDTHVLITATPWDGRVDTLRVRAQVENRSSAPLSRVLVQLSSDSSVLWDGLVIPVGRVEGQSEASGEIALRMDPGTSTRLDEVEVRVRGHGVAPQLVGSQLISWESSPSPTLRLAARLVDDGDPLLRAEVTVINESNQGLRDVEVRFLWPGDLDVEIVDHAVRLPMVGARDRVRADLMLIPGADAPEVLPLEVQIEASRHGRLVRWPLSLPLDGRTVTLSAPSISGPDGMFSAPAGVQPVALSIQDEGVLEHVVVYAHGRKVAWSGRSRTKVRLAPEIDIQPGPNTIYVTAQDNEGLVTRQRVRVYGEAPAAASADE